MSMRKSPLWIVLAAGMAEASSSGGQRVRSRESRSVVGRPLDGLDLQLDLHLLADEQPAALEHDVPAGAEVIAVDLSAGREPGAPTAPRVVALAEVLDVE